MFRFAADQVSDVSRSIPGTGDRAVTEAAPMPIFMNHRDVSGKWHGGVYAIGNFDGLHVGHQALIRQTVSIAAATGVRPSILTFDPHPRELFDPSALPFRLATATQKTCELAKLGAGFCLNQQFDMNFAGLTPSAFVERVLQQSLRASHVVVGTDFRFGSRQSGTTDLLEELCRQRNIGITVIDQVKVADEIVSSSLVRRHVAEGRMPAAAAILGRPWSVMTRRENVGERAAYDLSDYTSIKVGTYAVRVDGNASHAVVTEAEDGRQILLLAADPDRETAGPAIIEFIS